MEASVTEWSKVLRSGRSVFARVGSSPTACIFHFHYHTQGERYIAITIAGIQNRMKKLSGPVSVVPTTLEFEDAYHMNSKYWSDDRKTILHVLIA